MSMIKIKLNKKEVQCREGQSILEVARENGINIPTLCHQPGLEAWGSCWVCSVKVEGVKGFVTSCGTKAQEGMSIITDSPEVYRARKTALELLLSDHYADCDAPCKIACPDHVDIQTYVSLIANGKLKEAVEVIKRNLPLPMSIGRVCPAFCEQECRRMLVDEAVAIRQLKRCAADIELEEDWYYVQERKPASGKRIAVIGAGPAGLSCGYYLSSDGHEVDIFEAASQAGGWLRYGIPEYRLPKKVLDREIEIMCKNGMRIHYNKKLGADLKLSRLKKEYDAVFIATGAQLAAEMPLEGDTLEGLLPGVDYLRAVALDNDPDIGKKVAVVGGGDTAIDCARTALRKGADVTLLYRRTRKEMPAEAYEVDAAEKEGVHLKFLCAPVSMLGKNGKMNSLRIEKMRLGKEDASGRKRPEPTGETYTESFDCVIAAISQKVDISWLKAEDDAGDFPLTNKNTAISNDSTMHWHGNVFAGGDLRRGPATAIEAVADGRLAAIAIGQFLRGEIMESKTLFNSRKAERTLELDPAEFAHYSRQERLQAEEEKVGTRSGNFREVERIFPKKAAQKEAERCLECGCMVNTSCLLREYATEYGAEQDHFFGEINKHPIDDTHAFIARDPNKCINCGRCIRACAEIQGPAVLGYIYRGFTTLVGPEFGGRLDETACTSCGKCIDVCPTGALLPKTRDFKENPGYALERSSRCTECGAACYITIRYTDDTILQVLPKKGNSYNEEELCYKGRFAWQAEDLQYSASDLSALRNIPENTVMHLSPKMSNEMLREAMEFAAANKLSCVSTEFRTDPGDESKNRQKIADMHDMDLADEIILIGPLNQMLQSRARLAQLRGAKLIMIYPPQGAYRRFADVIYKEISENRPDPLKKQLFIYQRESIDLAVRSEIWDQLASLPNAKVWVNSEYLNSRGFSQFNIKKVPELKVKNLIIFGATPDNTEAENIIRLPLNAFARKGTVICDTGETIQF